MEGRAMGCRQLDLRPLTGLNNAIQCFSLGNYRTTTMTLCLKPPFEGEKALVVPYYSETVVV